MKHEDGRPVRSPHENLSERPAATTSAAVEPPAHDHASNTNSMAVGLDSQPQPSVACELTASGSRSGRGNEELLCDVKDNDQHTHQHISQVIASNFSSTAESVRESLSDSAALEAFLESFLDEWDDDEVQDATAHDAIVGDRDASCVGLHIVHRPVSDQDATAPGGAESSRTMQSLSSSRVRVDRATVDTSITSGLVFTSTRDRRKHEIAVLKKQEQELQARIGQFQMRDASVFTSGMTTTGRHATSSPRASLWWGIVKRQRERLAESQSENARLKEVLRDQKKMARSLHRILLKRAALVTTMERRLLPPPQWIVPTENEQTFRSLLIHSDAMYAETDAVVRTILHTRAPVGGGKFRQWDMKPGPSDGGDAMLLEMVNCEDLPFERSLVSEAMRRFFNVTKNTPSQHSGGDQTVETAVAVETLQLSYSSAYGSGCTRMRLVIRAFIEPSRCVFVQDTVIDPVMSSGQTIPGLVLLERKWTILTDIVPASSRAKVSSSVRGTRVQTYAAIVPVASSLSGLSTRDKWTKRNIEHRVIPAWDLGVSATEQRIENTLVSMATQRIRV